MIGVYLILSVMVGFIGIITLLDWLGQRRPALLAPRPWSQDDHTQKRQ